MNDSTMYAPRHFAEGDIAVLHKFISDHAFGTLVTVRAGSLVISHLPFVLDASAGRYGTLYAHLARANPQWRDFDGAREALAIFEGPHGYVSPRWYRPGKAVPTWNYTVAHARGVPRIVDDVAEVRRQQETLIRIVEGEHRDAWSLSSQKADYIDAMLRGIVAFALPIARLEGKFKLSQNRSKEDRSGVIDGLRASGRSGDAALADLMASRED